jgi:hypothetical protein
LNFHQYTVRGYNDIRRLVSIVKAVQSYYEMGVEERHCVYELPLEWKSALKLHSATDWEFAGLKILATAKSLLRVIGEIKD